MYACISIDTALLNGYKSWGSARREKAHVSKDRVLMPKKMNQ